MENKLLCLTLFYIHIKFLKRKPTKKCLVEDFKSTKLILKTVVRGFKIDYTPTLVKELCNHIRLFISAYFFMGESDIQQNGYIYICTCRYTYI